MIIKIESTRPVFRRLLKSIKKSSILKGHLVSSSNKILSFDFEEGDQKDIMVDVVKEYIKSQGINYEEI